MKLKNQKGAMALEFAIILPLLVVLIAGIIEFSLLLYNKQILTNASREGARAGIVQSVPRVQQSAIESVVLSYCEDHLVTFGSENTPIINPPPPICTQFGDDLTVTVAYDYGFLVIPNFIPGFNKKLTLTAETVMKCE